MHRTHHEPRTGILEDNDIFGVLNAAVVMPVLMQAYFAEPSYGAALRRGASMGISVFGCAYIAVHDGVHHERFWSRPLQQVAWFQAVSKAHAAHHTACIAIDTDTQGPRRGLACVNSLTNGGVVICANRALNEGNCNFEGNESECIFSHASQASCSGRTPPTNRA